MVTLRGNKGQEHILTALATMERLTPLPVSAGRADEACQSLSSGARWFCTRRASEPDLARGSWMLLRVGSIFRPQDPFGELGSSGRVS